MKSAGNVKQSKHSSATAGHGEYKAGGATSSLVATGVGETVVVKGSGAKV